MFLLYSFRRCPYAIRARMALLVSGIEVEIREVDLKRKPAALLAVSPKGTVPVLVATAGRVIDESLDIMHWALQQNDPKGWLAPDHLEMARVIQENDGPFKYHLDRYKYPDRYPAPHAATLNDATDHREEGAKILRALELRLITNEHLFGPKQSLADVATLPFVRQFARTDASWFAAQPWPRLQAWLTAFESSELYRQATTR